MKRDIDKDFSKYPPILKHPTDMQEPNSAIPVFKGMYRLQHEDQYIHIDGEINFAWLPSTGVIFNGIVKCSEGDNMQVIHAARNLKLYVDNWIFGLCWVSHFSMGMDCYIEGSMVRDATLGDKSISVSSVQFIIPNFITFRGLPVIHRDEKGIKICMNRLIFNNGEYCITIDKQANYDELHTKLESKGGYVNLYVGEITKLKGNISFDEAEDLAYKFSTFLSFLNGRRTSPLFLVGVHEEEILWRDFSDKVIDQYKFVPTWPSKKTTEGLNELWNAFDLTWKEESHKEFLITAIHWYIEANSGVGFTEGSIIMAQTDLELIYNWLIIEKKRLLMGRDAENINAANKIRLLLSHLSVDPKIPEEFPELSQFSDFEDGPDAIVQIRNALVHGQEEKRKKLTKISNRVKTQTLNLAIWYIELSLLNILNHNRTYLNRVGYSIFIQNREQYVPWVRVIKSKQTN
jgi:hypothetical protein